MRVLLPGGWSLSFWMLAALLTAAPAAAREAASLADPVVRTMQGRLVGMTEGGVSVFKGVPYATPPVGERRWRPPEPPAEWRGRRFAMSFSPQCTQLPYPEGSFFDQGFTPTSEDCLYLNVWTSSLDAGARRPVMVWTTAAPSPGAAATRPGTTVRLWRRTASCW